MDPLRNLFGRSSLELFSSKELVISDGPLHRLPPFMRDGPMESLELLCRSYVGGLEVAKGTASNGLQTPVAGAHPAALLRLGLTVFFQDMGPLLPASTDWLRALEAALGLPECAQLKAFANAPGSGLAIHHDRYDQLFFQIRGEKQFRYAPNDFVVRPNIQFSPSSGAPASFSGSYRHGFPLTCEEVLKKGLEVAHLKPGTALFMPAGTWHTTAEQEGEALSLVVVVRAPTRQELLLTLLQYYTDQSPEWRAPSYGGWGGDAEAMAREHEALRSLTVDLGRRLPSVADSDAHSTWSMHGYTNGMQSRYPLAGRFERYIRLPSSSLSFDGDAHAVQVRCIVKSGPANRPQTQMVLGIDAQVRPVLEWIVRTHAQFSVDELCQTFADFARGDLESILASLSFAAFLRPLPAPEWE